MGGLPESLAPWWTNVIIGAKCGGNGLKIMRNCAVDHLNRPVS